MKTVVRIECSQTPAPSGFFSYGPTRVVSSPLGAYREAEDKPFTRFGYRIHLERGKVYRLKVWWPNDRRRFMMIHDGSCYDLSTGVISGVDYPPSGKLECLEEVFRPRYDDLAVIFMTWDYGDAAAVRSFEIEEVPEGEFAPLKELPSAGGRRFGVQYEDPCGEGFSEGATNFGEWLDFVFRYLRHTGQNLFVYPIVWYHGPNFGGTSEAGDAVGTVLMPDRRMYNLWTCQPGNWPARILERCEKEDIDFYGDMRLMRLPSLMADPDPGIRSRLFDNRVQTTCSDWTLVYNARNYDELMKLTDPQNVKADYAYAYGEKQVPGLVRGPIFNPLHPKVQHQVKQFIGETCRLYAGYPHFKGLTLSLWGPTILWFGSLSSGYDDLNVGNFCREQGVELDIAAEDPERFSKRYAVLTGKYRREWLAWRCRKVAAGLAGLALAMRQVRPDLKLLLQLWVEPYLPAYYDPMQESSQLFLRKSLLEIYREAGLDLEMLAEIPNLEVSGQSDGGNRDRSFHNGGMFHDQDDLDEPFWNALSQAASPGVFVFNEWNESWGEHHWAPPPEGAAHDPNRAALSLHGAPAHFCRANSIYPEDGFWWENQSRITACFPYAPYYMESLIRALARSDALRLTAGGLYLDKAHTREFREFSCLYRALPERKFRTLGDGGDPVLTRNLPGATESWSYLLNLDDRTLTVAIHCAHPVAGRDWNTGKDIAARMILPPFHLHVLHFDGDNEILSTAVAEACPQERLDAARQLLAASFSAPAAFREALQAAVTAVRPVELRYLLNSYWARKCLAKPAAE